MLAGLLSRLVDRSHSIEALWSNSKGVEPVIDAVSYVSGESKGRLPYFLPFVLWLESVLSNIELVSHLGVGSDEEGNASEDQAEETTHIGKNSIDFPDSSGNTLGLGRLEEVHWDVAIGGDGDWVSLEALDEATSLLSIRLHGIGARICG